MLIFPLSLLPDKWSRKPQIHMLQNVRQLTLSALNYSITFQLKNSHQSWGALLLKCIYEMITINIRILLILRISILVNQVKMWQWVTYLYFLPLVRGRLLQLDRGLVELRLPHFILVVVITTRVSGLVESLRAAPRWWLTHGVGKGPHTSWLARGVQRWMCRHWGRALLLVHFVIFDLSPPE